MNRYNRGQFEIISIWPRLRFILSLAAVSPRRQAVVRVAGADLGLYDAPRAPGDPGDLARLQRSLNAQARLGAGMPQVRPQVRHK